MIDWSRIDTVLLDMDGTLLDLSFDNYFWLDYLPEYYARARGLPLQTARRQLTELSDSLRGSLQWYCLDHWSQALDLDIETLKQGVRDRIRFRPQAREFLAFLRDLDKEAVLVTNAHPGALELKVAASGLGPLLDRRISSHEFQLAKENPGFWPRLARRENLDLTRCLFIDDSLPVLRRAHAEGLGQVLHMLLPDTTQPPLPRAEFPAIAHFSELMPPLGGRERDA